MGSGIYIAAAGAVTQSDSLDVTANNVANASTDGFRGTKVSFKETLGTVKSIDSSYVAVGSAGSDVRPGTLKQTDNPLDLALVGDGFFAVKTSAGTRYTRAGAFRLDKANQLVDSVGNPVLEAAGNPITVPPEATSIAVAADGAVTADGAELGKIQLAVFKPEQLTREGDNLFSAKGEPSAGDKPSVVSGSLEASNVNIVRGVVDLVKTSRTYESLLKMIEGYRQIESRAARDLGTP